MKRRDFLTLSGLGAAGLFLHTNLAAAPFGTSWKAEEAVALAVETALKNGAVYVDARVGTCEILGHGAAFDSVSLFDAELLGLRVCTADGWRHLVLRDLDPKAIREQLPKALKARPEVPREGDYWVSAEFCRDNLIARKSSHPDTESQLNSAWLRYGDRPQLPKSNADLLFCDLLLEQ